MKIKKLKKAYRNHCYKTCPLIKTIITELCLRTGYPVSKTSKKNQSLCGKGFA